MWGLPQVEGQMTLCGTFERLARATWALMRTAAKVRYQPLEETITDTNILKLKSCHRGDIFTIHYNRRQEAKTGADWEWWFTNHSRNQWFGVRIQAKILKLQSRRYEALYYKNQTGILITDAARHGVVPLYCFYCYWPRYPAIKTCRCGTGPVSSPSYGCSIVDAYTIQGMKARGAGDQLATVMAAAYPWSCLVCYRNARAGADPGSLPNNVRRFFEVFLDMAAPSEGRLPRITEQPPLYVQRSFERDEGDSMPEDPRLAGVVVIVGDET